MIFRRELLLAPFVATARAAGGDPPIELFFALGGQDGRAADEAARALSKQWRSGLEAMLVDILQLPMRSDNPTRLRTRRLLEKVSHQSHGTDLPAWHRWIWSQPYRPHRDYAAFKGVVLESIDPRMRAFFPEGVHSRIRLDQILWGGVQVNGIPPLVNPKHLAAGEARYLKDGQTVFGIAWNGEARAYPKRVLAWHEMARDQVGGLDLTIVYCTLCGTVIPYRSPRGVTFGTSGLLYESSKLMFDEETLSLWSTIEGRPALGRLAAVDEAVLPQLEIAPVVTTTWGEWRREHPHTRVLSLDTGHDRNYGDGVAYRDYFGTDELMFPVSRADRRLKNKAEVLVIRRGQEKPPLAIASKLLIQRPVFQYDGYVVMTSASGASRVYRASSEPMSEAALRGGKATETELRMNGFKSLPRVPAHRAFWFGWYAQFPETELLR
jgi:hypothetical protein